jgi:tripartite ATP-independent transporter DctM subunit
MNDLSIIVVAFVLLVIAGVPLFVSVGITTALALFLIDIPYTLMSQISFSSLQPFPLLTIPLFVLSGRLMEVGGLAERLIDIARKMVGSYRGSTGMMTVLACMLFSALSGSGPATTAAIGSITIPVMQREGYTSRFAGAVAAAGGALGSMIPPSNLLILYGLLAEQSIPRLFLAGFVPGFFVTALLVLIAYVIARRNGFGEIGQPFAWRPFLDAINEGKWSLGAPVLILGGIYSGAFTPTEAAGVAVFYALIVGMFIYKGLTWIKVYESLRFTALMSGLLIIIAPSYAFGQLSAFYDVGTAMQELITSYTTNVFIVMMLIGLLYIFVGTFMESLAQLVLFTPVFLPVAMSLGVDPVLFGIFSVMTAEIGFLTPPLGGNLNIASKIAKVSIEDLSVAVLPFILAYLIGLLFLIFFPEATLFLPDLVYGVSK